MQMQIPNSKRIPHSISGIVQELCNGRFVAFSVAFLMRNPVTSLAIDAIENSHTDSATGSKIRFVDQQKAA